MTIDTTIWTIEELYNWAVLIGVEGYTLLCNNEAGIPSNVDETEILITDTEKTKTVYL